MSDATSRKKLTSLWLIVALTTAPVAASYLVFYFWPPQHSVNLLPPETVERLRRAARGVR